MVATLDADTVVFNARIATMDAHRPEASAVALRGERVMALGSDADVLARVAPGGRRIDAHQRRVVPGLIDSHLHLIRGGLSYNMELRWDGVRSLAEAMRRLREQVLRTPPPQWVRVVGGWSELQFEERRMPTLEEINRVAPETPVFILHLYSHALLNAAALRAVGYGKDTPDPPGGVIERDRQGHPTGLLVAKPNAAILYATLARGPRLLPDDQENSTRHFMRELNRLGLTGVADAGGGKTFGGTALRDADECLSRHQALRLFTCANDWFLGAPGELGVIAEGALADFAILSDDYFEVPEDRIAHIESVVTVVGGRIVHASGEFGGLAPPPLPFSPGWSPPGSYGGYDEGLLASPSQRQPILGCACAAF